MKVFKQNTKEKVFMLCIFIWGLIMSFLIPTWQIPDESAHIQEIFMALGEKDFAATFEQSVGIEKGRIETHPEEKVNKEELWNAMSKEPDYRKSDAALKSVQPYVLKRLPATIGIMLGIILGLPSYWTLQLGEIFALIFYIYVCYKALVLMPMKKETLAVFIGMPIIVQQSGSVGYDAVVIPLMFYFMAYIFYLRYEKENVVLKDLLILILCWLLIAYIKMPYLFIGLLFLMIPRNKFKVNFGRKMVIDARIINRWRFPTLIVLSILCIIGIYLQRHNLWIQVVYGFCVEWKRGIYLIYMTAKTWWRYLVVSSVGQFGWLDAPIAFGAAIAVYVITFVFSIVNSSRNDVKIRKWDRLILWGTFLILTLFTVLSMANHTIMVTLFGSEQAEATYNIREAMYAIPYIGGLQGRYFTPYLFLLFAPFGQVKQISEKKSTFIFAAFEIILTIYIFNILIQRYW